MRLSLIHIAAAAVVSFSATSVGAQQHDKHQQGTKKAEMKGHDMQGHDMKDHAMSPWKEMDAFHANLGASFHPAEKGNLVPLKAKAADLATSASAWAASTAPASCASAEIKSTVADLAKRSNALAEQVRNGASDTALTESITAIHTSFETLEKGCVAKHDMKGMKH